jgi:serine/threonine protein kinase
LYTWTGCQCHSESGSNRCFLLSDFGFSQPIVRGNTFESLECRGTRAYIAPELVKRREYSFKTDIWAFGCIMFEVATSGKKLAFENEHESQRYAEGRPDYPLPQLTREDNPELSEGHLKDFNSLLALCLHREPARRPSAKRLRVLLNKWKDQTLSRG